MTAFAFSGASGFVAYTGGSGFVSMPLTETVDTSGWHDNTTNPSYLTVPATGWYVLFANTNYQKAGGGSNGITSKWLKNGMTQLQEAGAETVGTGTPTSGTELCYVAYLAAGEYVELQIEGTATETVWAYVSVFRLPGPMFVGDYSGAGSGSGVLTLTETLDQGGWWSSGAPSRATVTTTGNYLYISWVYDSLVTNVTSADVLVNGASIHTYQNVKHGGVGRGVHPMVGIVPLTAGDYVEISASNTSVLGQLALAYIPGIRCAMVGQSTGQSLPTNVLTTILYDTESVDTDAFHSTSSNTGRLTAPVDGTYATFTTLKALAIHFEQMPMAVFGSQQYKNVATGSSTEIGSVLVGGVDSMTTGQYAYSQHQKGGTDTTIPATTVFAIVQLDDFVYLELSPFVQQIYRRKGGAR